MRRTRTLKFALMFSLICVASAASVFVLIGGSSGGSVTTYCGVSSCTTQTSSTPQTRTSVSVTSTSATSVTSLTGTTTIDTIVTTTTTSQVVSSTTTSKTQETPHRLGFWLQELDIQNNYTPQAFFNAMFLTPPYPTSADIMTFGPVDDQVNKYGCSSSTPYTGGSINYWSQVAGLADAYPKVQLVIDVAFDGANGGNSTYGLPCFSAFAQFLGKYSSVYGLGVEGEYTPGLTTSELQTVCNTVNSLGKQCINYYASQKGVTEPNNGYEIKLTSFPAQGDQVGTLQLGGSHFLGLASGYYDNFPFPSNFTCPIGPNDVPPIGSSLTQEPQGWNQCVISTELQAAVNFSPPTERQFLEFAVGFSEPNQTFMGASGQNTTQLWDNPTLRSWIWTDINYQTNFVLSK